MDIAEKIKLREELSPLRQQLTRQQSKVVFTNGCFDILHRGHVAYLIEARQLGDCLILGLNSDDSVRKLKGPGRPLQSEDDRAFILASLSCVDYVTIFDEPTPLQLIQEVQPDILVKGGDYLPKDIVGKKFVESRNGKVMTIPFLDGRSTSSIVDNIVSMYQQGLLNPQEN